MCYNDYINTLLKKAEKEIKKKMGRQREGVDKGKMLLKMRLKLIEKGLEIGVNEFTLNGPERYEVLSVLSSSGINFSYECGNLKIQKNK